MMRLSLMMTEPKPGFDQGLWIALWILPPFQGTQKVCKGPGNLDLKTYLPAASHNGWVKGGRQKMH